MRADGKNGAAGDRLPIVALEIAPLSERHHSGIANVARNLASQMLADETVEPRFFFNRQEIPGDVVRHLVDLEGGAILHWLAGRASAGRPFAAALDRPVIGIFTNHKWHRGLFPFEVLILHDLTTLVTPQFHNQDNIDFGNGHRLVDALSSDLIVAVSDSTRQDLRTYHPEADHIPCIVAPLGPSLPAEADGLKRPNVEPYVLVLGTLEPRKNVAFIFEYLGANPGILDRYSFVFTGRWGWGESGAAIIDACGLRQQVDRGRIRLTGFVSDSVRDTLLANARCCVYASLYEGFGLPILEALSFGVPVVTGHGSSLPEAGGDLAVYCDASSPASFGTALERALADGGPEAEAARKAWARRFSWRKTYETIRDEALAMYRDREAADGLADIGVERSA